MQGVLEEGKHEGGTGCGRGSRWEWLERWEGLEEGMHRGGRDWIPLQAGRASERTGQ